MLSFLLLLLHAKQLYISLGLRITLMLRYSSCEGNYTAFFHLYMQARPNLWRHLWHIIGILASRYPADLLKKSFSFLIHAEWGDIVCVNNEDCKISFLCVMGSVLLLMNIQFKDDWQQSTTLIIILIICFKKLMSWEEKNFKNPLRQTLKNALKGKTVIRKHKGFQLGNYDNIHIQYET